MTILHKLDDVWENTRVRMNRVKPKWWMVIFTFVLTVATALSFLVMFWQNLIMKDQMDQTDRTIALTQLQQRAWLATSADPIQPVEGLREIDVISSGENFLKYANWKIVVRNTGSTPGTIKHSEIMWIPNTMHGKTVAFDSAEWRAILTKEARAKAARSTVIAPGDKLTFGMQDVNQSFSVAADPEERVRQWAHSRLIGLFIYTDVFGEEHTLFCCYRHNPVLNELANHHEDGYAD